MANEIDRRRFIHGMSWAALLAAHPSFGGGPEPSRAQAEPLISRIELETKTNLEQLRRFYEADLGLRVESISARCIRIHAGASIIDFVRQPDPSTENNTASGQPPFYHFAFNIPENKIVAARRWQLERTPLFLTPHNLRDPAYPDDVRHFRSWNAHSVFFFDPAGNVLEHIARHGLANASPDPESFGPDDLLCVSEIAMVVDDAAATGAELQTATGLPAYGSTSQGFAASGDENGLLLLFRRGRELGDSLGGDSRPAQIHATRVSISPQRASGGFSSGDYPHEVNIG